MVRLFRERLSARRGAAAALVLAFLAGSSTPCLGLVEILEGNQPVGFNDAAWPGLAAVVNDPSRVLLTLGPTIQSNAYYRGDTAALERVLAAFASVRMEERIVTLRSGRGNGWPFKDKASPYDWGLEANQGDPRARDPLEYAKLLPQGLPSLTVYVGGDVDLARLRIPEGITLVGMDELRERCHQDLRSGDASARGAAARELTNIDPYGKESVAAVERLLKDEAVRRAAESAIAVFEERAKDPPAVKASYRDDERRIRRFIFDWRYGWLKRAVAVAVVAAGALLAATVVVARARRTRGAEAT